MPMGIKKWGHGEHALRCRNVASCRGYGRTKWGAQLLSAPVPLPRIDATLAAAAFNPRTSVLRAQGSVLGNGPQRLRYARSCHSASDLEPPCLSNSLRSTTAFAFRAVRAPPLPGARRSSAGCERVGGAAFHLSTFYPRLDGEVYHTNVRRKVLCTPPFLRPRTTSACVASPRPFVHPALTALVALTAAASALIRGQVFSARQTSAPLVATIAACYRARPRPPTSLALARAPHDLGPCGSAVASCPCLDPTRYGLRAAGVRAELARPRHSRSVRADDSRHASLRSRHASLRSRVHRARLCVSHHPQRRYRDAGVSRALVTPYGQCPSFFALAATFRLVLATVHPRKSVGCMHTSTSLVLSLGVPHTTSAHPRQLPLRLSHAVPTAEEGIALARQVVLWMYRAARGTLFVLGATSPDSLDYYFQTLGYLHSRKERRAKFDKDIATRDLKPTEHAKKVLRPRTYSLASAADQARRLWEVFLARKQETGEVCALKKMRKRTLFKMDEIRHVLVERDILTATKTPWLDPQFVYLAMEYVPGGDFRMLLNNPGVLKEEHARFYISEMFAAVNELHKLGYIHRDLKSEVKLPRRWHWNFGLATGALNPKLIESLKVKLDKVKDNQIVHRSSIERRSIYCSIRNEDARYVDSIVGSPDYMAPRSFAENHTLIRSTTGPLAASSLSSSLASLFSVAALRTKPGRISRIGPWSCAARVRQARDLVFNLTDVAWDAVTCLIAHATTRYSSIGQVSVHSFFDGVGWDDLRSVNAPFVPVLDSEIDTGYHDDFTSLEDMAKYAEVKEK
ncbi:kinase-like domain-containing protein [Mycena galopus ATCC 62051]|nr:kinase-like domain-containing protein [Mycena galopus ATCC 62051]